MNEIYCGSMNIEQFVTRKKPLKVEDKKKMEEVIAEFSNIDAYPTEKQTLQDIKIRLIKDAYDFLNPNIFAISKGYNGKINSLPEFLPILVDRTYFRLSIDYSTDKSDKPIVLYLHDESFTKGKYYPDSISHALAKTLPVLKEYDNIEKAFSDANAKEVRTKIMNNFQSSKVSEDFNYSVKFLLPETTRKKILESQKLGIYTTYFVIQAKSEFWNSEKHETPQNVLAIAHTHAPERFFIIDAFNPREIPGDIYG